MTTTERDQLREDAIKALHAFLQCLWDPQAASSTTGLASEWVDSAAAGVAGEGCVLLTAGSEEAALVLAHAVVNHGQEHHPIPCRLPNTGDLAEAHRVIRRMVESHQVPS